MTIKYYDTQQPRQYYLDSLAEFYIKLDSKEFWADTRQQEIALEAISQDYIRTDHKEYKRVDAVSFQAAMTEYQHRKRYMGNRAKRG